MNASSSTRFLYPDAIVSSQWLADNLHDPKLRLYECTVYLHYTTRADGSPAPDKPYDVVSGRADYDRGHIPGAAFLDLQADLSDNSSPSHLRFTMLPLETLAERFGAAGIGDESRVVLYSRASMQWATRVWWMLRAVGFDNAAILDGGFDNWTLEQREISTQPRSHAPQRLSARPRPELFCGRDQVLAAIGDQSVCTLNALMPDLHSGENPRYGRPGRIPGSVNLPAAELVDPQRKTFLTPQQTAQAFASVGADRAERTIVYCGGGIAATLDAFLLHQLGARNLTVYDASMSEWARDSSLPIETD